MSWNGSQTSAQPANGKPNRPAGKAPAAKPPRSRRTSSPFTFHLYFLLALVALGCAALYLFTRPDDAPAPAPTPDKPSAIADSTPAAPTNRVASAAPAPKVLPPQKIGEVRDGYIKLPSGRLHRQLGVITNSVVNRPKAAYQIFKHSSENEIACYLWLKPGDSLIGDLRYDGTFTKDFLASLKEPITISPDDTPEQVELKNQVIESKKYLKEAYDRGEDIEKIMQSTRKELQTMMLYKNEVRNLYDEAKERDCKTDADVEDLVNACNKMLEEKGIAPMKLGPFGRMKFRKVKKQ